MRKKITYAQAGVKYDRLDSFKRKAQRVSENRTKFNVRRLGLEEVTSSRGEPVYLIEDDDRIYAHTEEGLGTKSIIADEMYHLRSRPIYYFWLGVDTVAAIANDLATAGAKPVSIAMHLATGSSDWFNDDVRATQFLHGVASGCNMARANWGQGETSVLIDIINPKRCQCSGSGFGIIKPKERRIAGDIQAGDAIVFLESTGIHTNGATLIRKMIETPAEYLTELKNGITVGDALLEPSAIYAPIIEDCLNQGIPIHYATHITGHGLCKLMRPKQPFEYFIECVPRQQLIFSFIQARSRLSLREMYATFNMGVGYALYVPEGQVDQVIKITAECESQVITAFRAGQVKKSSTKQVIIKPHGITFTARDLQIR